jgi:hypothetical protein
VGRIPNAEVLMKMRLVMMTAALALVAVACGGGGANLEGVASLSDPDAATTVPAPDGSTGGDSTDGSDAEVDTEQALLDFAECMREHGIEIEDPSISGEGGGFIRIGPPPGAGGADGDNPDFEEMQAAREACSEFLEGITQQFGEIDPTERQDQALEFAQCMRDQGIDMPDPDFSDFGPGVQGEEGGDDEARGGPFGDFDPEDPAFQAALEECGDVFGGALGGRGGRGGRGGPGGGSATDPDEQ